MLIYTIILKGCDKFKLFWSRPGPGHIIAKTYAQTIKSFRFENS